tara:strand:+ start:238 stop:708 length:471 start_codon:yes stop_codon:yes gene_type:complete
VNNKGNIMNIELNKVYEFDLTGKMSFGDISIDRLYDFFKDGRNASFMLEEQLTHWFTDLTRVEGNKDHDHFDSNGVLYDAKNFTKGGLRFMPSNQMGAGRKFNETIAHEKADKLVYICCDIVDFPKVRVVFKSGKELVKSYPKCSVPRKDREVLFG